MFWSCDKDQIRQENYCRGKRNKFARGNSMKFKVVRIDVEERKEREEREEEERRERKKEKYD